MNSATAQALGITYAITEGSRRGQVSRLMPAEPRRRVQEYPGGPRGNAPNPLEPIMVGGSMARVLSGYLGSPGTSVTPRATRAPTTQMGDAILDRNGNVIGYTRELGDATDSIAAAARQRVMLDAHNYVLPAVPTTLSEAIMAFMLLMSSARSENTKSGATYKKMEDAAAYAYRNAAPLTVLNGAVAMSKGAPRTNALAQDIRRRFMAAPSVKASKRHRSSVSPVAPVDTPASEPVAPTPPWYASLPEWAPMAAGAAGIAVVALLVFPRHRSA